MMNEYKHKMTNKNKIENNKETLENYKVRERCSLLKRVDLGAVGLVSGIISGAGLVDKTLEVASKMYNYMQTNTDFNYTSLSQFCNVQDGLEGIICATGIIMGGALLSCSLFTPKYEIYKENGKQ